MSIFAVPKQRFWSREAGARVLLPRPKKERCRSGRSGRTRNAVYGQLYRGFESLSLRNKGCKSSDCEIYTFFTPNFKGLKIKIYADLKKVKKISLGQHFLLPAITNI